MCRFGLVGAILMFNTAGKKMMLGEYDTPLAVLAAGGRFGFIVVAGLIALVVYFIWFR